MPSRTYCTRNTRRDRRHALLAGAVLVSLLLSLISGAGAQPALAAPAESAAASADAALSIVTVAAPAVNCLFDIDCTITVDDTVDAFTPPAAVGDAFLQSRLWPAGEAGTPGAGLYPYLYRIDMRNATAVTAVACVTTMRIDFGPVVPFDYNKDAKPDHVFVVTVGGIGSVAPASATQSGGVITFHFDPAVCAGSSPGNGQSSFFFGLVSAKPPRPVIANLDGTAGLSEALEARAPMPSEPPPGCFELKHEREIPSPALIDFDDMPDETPVANHYEPTHGVVFENGKETHVRTYGNRPADPTVARSAPNVAINDATFPLTSENRPLAFTFRTGKTHVGFYMGNGATAGLTGAMVGYDAAGNVICQVTNTPVPESYSEFIGMYDPAGRIVKVTLNYGASLLNESIDDLYFAPAHDGPFAAPAYPGFAGGVRVAVGDMDNKVFDATFYFPIPQLIKVDGPDQHEYTQMITPGIDPHAGTPGSPDVPVYRRMLAVPAGATLHVGGVQAEPGKEVSIGLLLPAQPSPVDAPARQDGDDVLPPPEAFANLPFTRTDALYRSSEPFPAQVVEQPVYMGKVRDLDVWQIGIAAAQYLPAKGLLLPYKSVQVKFSFEGGAEGFLPASRQNNPFDGNGNLLHDPESTATGGGTGADDGGGLNPLYEQVLNRAVISRYLIDDIVVAPICWGSEYLIITDPAFRPAADDLRAWKNAKGISTQVVETGAGAGKAGATREQIRDFVKNRYDHCLVRPSYLLLLGDAEHIAPFYRDVFRGTDLDYALMTPGDILPDLAYGRIPVDTLADAQRVVDKIVDFEQSPPFAPAFYSHMSFASYFECCRPGAPNPGTDDRSFVETSELVRSGLMGYGYNVERIYTTDPGVTPRRYYNGALLPADIGAGSGFAWDGTDTDIVDAINAGRILVFHRDHGGVNGWVDPNFTSADLPGLTNGALTPVVYSVNCASGLFDNETLNPAVQDWAYGTAVGGSYWAERILRMEGGAVSVIGDTRNSPTWANSALARGLFDATWPNVLPADGGANRIRRLGDILNYAKLYMVGQVGVAQTAGSVSANSANTDVILYHVIGDPTLQLWTRNPWVIKLPILVKVIEFKPDIWKLEYPVEGAILTALQDGTPIARGKVHGGAAMLVALGDGSVRKVGEPMQLVASLPSGESVLLDADVQTGEATPGAGGTLENPAHGFHFVLPPGATNVPLTLLHRPGISITVPLPDPLAGLDFFALDAFQPDGQPKEQFDKPWTAEIKYDPAELGGQDEGGLRCLYLDEADGQWKPVASSVDAAADTLRCQADHFTDFAVAVGPALPLLDEKVYLPVVTKGP